VSEVAALPGCWGKWKSRVGVSEDILIVTDLIDGFDLDNSAPVALMQSDNVDTMTKCSAVTLALHAREAS
jgi:hypothetical protein